MKKLLNICLIAKFVKMKIKVKKLNEEAVLPRYAHDGDAGMDVFSCEDAFLYPGDRKMVRTGLSFEIPKGFEIQVRPKSGLSLKNGLTILNTPGTLDSGYRGELGIILFNTTKETYEIKKGQKIAQVILARYEEAEVEEVGVLGESERGEGGFGSTGLN